MGKPKAFIRLSVPEHIGHVKRTWGSETSQYPEENKSNEIPSVVASESGKGQTGRHSRPGL